MLTYCKQIDTKTARINRTRSYFQTFGSFLFPYFNSYNLYSVDLFCIRWSFVIDLFANTAFQTFDYFENAYLLSCRFYCVDIFYIKFRFFETLTVTNSVTRISLVETLYKMY